VNPGKEGREREENCVSGHTRGRSDEPPAHAVFLPAHAFFLPVRAFFFPAYGFLFPLLLAAQDPISDNSFLIEEAYNQEPGVVQHIGNFLAPDAENAWAFIFTQEWPLGGMRHQLSYTVPILNPENAGTGLGDIAVNYRYQLRGLDGGPLAVAPRLTMFLPTGSEEGQRGLGSFSMQANLPVSYMLGPSVATHWNAGVTLVDDSAPIWNLGASAVWLLRPSFNVLVETVWLGQGGDDSALLNPGIRWAHNFASGLQIVPGVAYTIGLGPSSGDDGLFLYLSFEHPFKH
jgi:hypothetical protein